MIKDTHIGNYIVGIRYDFNICKYRILIALNCWKDDPVWVDKTSFAKDIPATVFDSEESALYAMDIIYEIIMKWEDFKEHERARKYQEN
jgi:hypothetical protein